MIRQRFRVLLGPELRQCFAGYGINLQRTLNALRVIGFQALRCLWIDLGQKLCIHGSPNPGDFSPAGCISLRGRDAGDLMGILSQGSAITVRR